MRECDVIIPVYNAYDAVKACIESVLDNTTFNRSHLILIDDKSPDGRIIPLLEGFREKNPKKIILLKNEKNLGFVGTVNKGMKYSKNDVVLLNSDTEVPNGWLVRMKECAYSDNTIATVTPLSNNATLASVPKMFYRNELPSGVCLEEMDNLVRSCSLREYPEIPTAHGFCMYIKREVLDKVGYFDEVNFGKGYGEENDYSFRCFKYGYRNVLCDDVYVLHKESQSFLNNKVDNSAILAKKHPALKSGLDYWNSVRDIRKIGDNVALKIGIGEDRPNILFLVHDFSNIEENVGGTTLHILDIITSLRGKYNFHVLAPENGIYKVHSFFKDTDLITSVYEKPIIIEPIGIHSNRYKLMVEDIINNYQITFVHIHHMIGHFFDIGDVCQKLNVKYVVSLHDLYLDIPVPSLMDKRITGDVCAPIDLDSWRTACVGLMRGAVKVVAPSKFTKKIYNNVYDDLRISVIGHGVKIKKLIAENKVGEMRNIAFVGAVFPHKGSEILSYMVKSIRKEDKIKIHLFGTTTANVSNSKNIVNHGKYRRDDLPKLMKENGIDLVCAFSLAPETYAYTVDEAVACGVPVVTFDIGAGAERVREYNLGWVIKYTHDEQMIITKVKEILDDKENYIKVLQAINDYKMRSVLDMARDYDKIYKVYIKPKRLDYAKMKNKMLEADFVFNVLALNYSSSYRDEYFGIINSPRWKLVSKIKIPSKIKKMLKVFYGVGRRK